MEKIFWWSDKKTGKMPTKIFRFIGKRISFPFRKLKLDEKSNGEASQENCSKNPDEFWHVKPINRRITSGKRVAEKVLKCDEEEEERSEMKLCKKRILMGEKCSPLNLSGALHYDTNGVLLPEEVLWQIWYTRLNNALKNLVCCVVQLRVHSIILSSTGTLQSLFHRKKGLLTYVSF